MQTLPPELFELWQEAMGIAELQQAADASSPHSLSESIPWNRRATLSHSPSSVSPRPLLIPGLVKVVMPLLLSPALGTMSSMTVLGCLVGGPPPFDSESDKCTG